MTDPVVVEDALSLMIIAFLWNITATVTLKPPNKGHIGDNIAKFTHFALCREVVLFSKVLNVAI